MIISVLLIVIAILAAINIVLWRLGAVQESQNPKTVLDNPVMDAKERKAIVKRLKRWKEEGKLSPAEFDSFYRLCESEWDS